MSIYRINIINLINIDTLNSYRYRSKEFISIRRFRIDTLNSSLMRMILVDVDKSMDVYL